MLFSLTRSAANRFVFAVAAVLIAAGTLHGQDDTAEPPTLPEVEVRPDEEESPPADDGAGDFDGILIDPTFDPFERYPTLSTLEFGGMSQFDQSTGALRSRQSLFETPFAGSVVTQEQIREKQAADMFDALENEVGVLMQSTAAGQASPFVRGVTGQQVLILIDGIRMNNSVYRFGPNQYFNTIDPGMVDHIEVVRGAGSTLWGSDAIGGVINVVTRGADVDRGLAYDGYEGAQFTQYFNTANSLSYSRMNVEGWVGSTGLFTGGSFSNVRNLDTGFDAIGRQPGTNYQQYAGDLKFNLLTADNALLTIALQHYEQESLPRSDRFPGFPGDLNNSNTPGGARFFDPQQRDLAYIRYQMLYPNEAMDALTTTVSYHRQREVQTRGLNALTRFQEIDVESFGLNLVAAKHLGGSRGKLTYGIDYYYDDVDSPFGGAASGPIIPDDATYERTGLFVNWEVPLTGRLNAVMGGRFEHIDLEATPVIEVNNNPTPVFIQPHYQDWIGHIGLSYQLDHHTRLVGSISEGFRAPNLDELTANNPNVLQEGMDLPSLGLSPEHSVTYEVGLKTNHHRLRTQTFIYWTDLNDNIVPVTAGPNQFTRENQDSYIQGVEFDGELVFENDWSLYGNFWYTFGRNDFTGAPLSRIPPTQGIVGLRWRPLGSHDYFAIYTWLVATQDRLDPVRG